MTAISKGAVGRVSRPTAPLGRRLAGLAEFPMAFPAIALFALFELLPTVLAVVYSFASLDSFGTFRGFVGFDNYVRLLSDANSVRALGVTAVLASVGTVLINVIGVGLAVLLNHPGTIYHLYRAAIFYPFVISGLVVGFIWRAILNPDGAINSLLRGIGLPAIPFLSDGNTALATVIGVTIWNSLGVTVILYLAGLQTVPAELLEAASVDGANAWQRFRKIVWPLLGPTVTINIVLTSIGLLRTYDLIVSLTGGGGPAGQTETIAYRIISLGLAGGQVGQSSAGAVLLFLATIVLAGVVLLLRRRNEDIT
ncbi:carbohydrate ABC transporter permease [Protaetiibacter mangrovi]|uniref:Sugar ABC transporter permease n=1 Tax=Protaetiibacter mangrovi TaxID=2970926 RepID=A0ABT1ZHB2_9MICO|nr:sugar ABC transporter permease [Protaetiibacter mangrovi]MCS0500091.1 sugar ABC transporter permease [Protaetiibacter mangrovi]TPX04509.1 sugar ABC transporter permease [Schumannella luteola]